MAKIGGWDVINADARQWNVAVGAPAVASISNWGSLAAVPYLGQAFYGLKDFSVTFLVKTDGGRVEHAFTGDVIAEELAKRLRPDLAKLLK